MKKTSWMLTESHEEDTICLNSEARVFIYSQVSSTVKTVHQRKLYVYVENSTSEKNVRAVRARIKPYVGT